jgi:hypothetical protein
MIESSYGESPVGGCVGFKVDHRCRRQPGQETPRCIARGLKAMYPARLGAPALLASARDTAPAFATVDRIFERTEPLDLLDAAKDAGSFHFIPV